MLITDIQELKRILEISPDDTVEDVKLTFLMEWVSNWMDELLDRPLSYGLRTEYYNGTGTQQLLLKSRPVYTTASTPAYTLNPTPIDPIVYVDGSGYYNEGSQAFASNPGSSPLTYGSSFILKMDNQPDNSSRCGILVRIGDYWPKPTNRQSMWLTPYIGDSFGNVQVQYTAGYTLDTLPATLRMAADLLIAKLRYVLPTGLEMSSESYEERSISILTQNKSYLLSLVRPMITSYRSWTW